MRIDKISINPCGGRKATAYLRQMNEIADQYEGVALGFNPYQIIRLLKSVGSEFGFSCIHINHLEYLINHTQTQDWVDGEPIVYKSVSNMAVDQSLSERQIAERENALHRLGALTWRDSGNHKRYGYRDRDGHIVEAFGVNLSPIVTLLPDLERAYEVQQVNNGLWVKLKRQIGFYRKQVRQFYLEMDALGLDVEDLSIFVETSPNMKKRIRASTSLADLKAMLEALKFKSIQLKEIFDEGAPKNEDELNGDNPLLPAKTAARAEVHRSHKYYTYNTTLSEDNVIGAEDRLKDNRQDTNHADRQQGSPRGQHVVSSGIRSLGAIVNGKTYNKSRKVDPTTTGIQHIKIGNLFYAMSPIFKVYLKHHSNSIGWSEIVDTAQDMCGELGIRESLWADSCHILGRNAAAIAIVIIDSNQNHPTAPIKSPAAVLHAMLVRAQSGSLSLHQSLFGILARSNLKGSFNRGS